MSAHKKIRKPRRTEKEVRNDIMNAVGTVLQQYGIAKMGINLVSEQADIDKKVIYRKYGTFDNLLAEYIDKHDYWLTTLPMKEFSEIKDLRTYLKELVTQQFHAILENQNLQELLSWELADKTELTKKVAQKREDYALKILGKLEQLTANSSYDFSATIAIIISGIYYIILHKNISTMCGLDINKTMDLQRTLTAITDILDFLFDAHEQKSKIEKIVINAHNEGIETPVIAKITTLEEQDIIEILKNT